MISKKQGVSITTITRDMKQIRDVTGNVYESVSIISKRANQIAANTKEELSLKLEEFSSHSDNLEEVFENREQIEISRHYEKQPKATLSAIQEWLDDKVAFRYPEEEEN